MNENTLIKRSDPKYDDDLVNLRYLKTVMFDLYHPVGEVFITINDKFDPNKEWHGKWERLSSDTYLKIVNDNAGRTGGTSSEHKIPVASLPAHKHDFKGFNGLGDISYLGVAGSAYSPQASIGNSTDYYGKGGVSIDYTGGNNAYYPYYYGVYAWLRIK